MAAGLKDNWCDGGNKWVEVKKACKVRCSKCNRRLMARTVLHHPEHGEVYGIDGYRVPMHKEKK